MGLSNNIIDDNTLVSRAKSGNAEALTTLLEKYSEERFKQIEEMSSFHKLNQKLDFSKCDGKTNYDYIIKKYLKENT